MSAPPINPDGWSTACCSECVSGPAPEPWKSAMQTPAPNDYWTEQPSTGFQACPCEAIVTLTDQLGMFEKGETCGVSKGACYAVSCVGCVVMTAQAPLACCFWCHLAKLRIKTAEKFGFKPESMTTAMMMSFAPGISVTQITREWILRGAYPGAKPGAGGPTLNRMER